MMPQVPNTASPRVLVAMFERYGLKPRQGFGQNFIIDGNTVDKIADAAAIAPEDAVLEIGPGAGALTVRLAERRARVLALELDRGLVRLLQELLQPFSAVRILQGDALAADWRALNKEHLPPGDNVKLVSNLPYNISSPLLYSILKQGFPFTKAVLMFQKEVAQRVVASPGESNYGSLSVLCRYYTRGRILFKVSRHVFWPRPGVDSAVLELAPHPPELAPAQEALFWQVVQAAFQKRRKIMLNTLLPVFDWPRDVLGDLLREASVDPGCRPETLTVHEFANLTRIIYNYISPVGER